MIRSVLLLLVLFPATALCAPEAPLIRVRARTRVEVATALRIAGGVAVDGALWDDALGAGVAGKPVTVQLRGAIDTLEVTGITDDRGAFHLVLPAPIGTYDVQASFLGDRDYAAPPAYARTIDIARRPITLLLSAPERAGLGAGLPLTVEARDGKTAAALALTLTLTATEAGSPSSTATVSTGSDGRGEGMLALPSGIRPGAQLLLRATFAGDAVHDAAAASRPVLVTSSSTLTAALEGPSIHRGEALGVTGRLSDTTGPLAGEVVEAISAGDARLGEATTDAAGRFRIAAATGSLAPGEARLAVHYRPPLSYRDPARSASLDLTVLPPAPIPLAGYLLPPLATLALLALAWTLRRHPWRLLRRARIRPADSAFPEERRSSPGLVAARPKLRATFGRPHDHGLDGVVWDAPFDRPVPAQMSIIALGPEASASHQGAVACDSH
ncbi:MAG: carboxypeptidase regulatory-like domain-containing protein, partial [Myxococcales bacterium]|nr:carboxypeptidase regulatory-like domain-containing protein [Myxococcales bacterium]